MDQTWLEELSTEEKMIYYFEQYKEALNCGKKEEADYFLALAKQHMDQISQIE